MDRHVTTSAKRGSKAAAWKSIIPVVLMAGSVQPLLAQSTLRILPAPAENRAPQVESRGAQGSRAATEASALQVVTTSEIRIVTPTATEQLSWAPTVAAEDLWAPLSQSSPAATRQLSSNLAPVPAVSQQKRPELMVREPQELLARRYQFSPAQGRASAVQGSRSVAASQIRILSPEAVETVAPTSESHRAAPSIAKAASGESTFSVVVMPRLKSPLPSKVAPEKQPAPTKAVAELAKPPVFPPVATRQVEPAPALVAAAPVVENSSPEKLDRVAVERPSLVERLFLAGLVDAPAPQLVADTTTAPRTSLMGQLTPDVVAKRFPAESQQPVARVARREPEEKPVDVAATAPAVSRPAQTTKEPVAAAPVPMPKVIEHPVAAKSPAKPVPQPELVARAPALTKPAPLPAPTKVAAPPRNETAQKSTSGQPASASPQVAATPSRTKLFALPAVSKSETVPSPVLAEAKPPEDKVPQRVVAAIQPVLDNESVVASARPQQPNCDLVNTPSENTQRVASLHASPMHTVRASAASTAAAPPIETFTFADHQQPTSSLIVKSRKGRESEELTLPEVAMDVAAPSVQDQATNDDVLVGPAEPSPSAVLGSREPIYMPFGCPYLPGQSGAPFVCGVDCGRYGAPCCSSWQNSSCIPWSLFGPGEYVGPARTQHVSTYYLRVNDLITLTYITSRRKEAERYRIGCGDRLGIEWLRGPTDTDTSLDRQVLVQPDGTIALPLVGEVNAAGKTVSEVAGELQKFYGKYQRDPQITVTPLEVNTAIEDIIRAVTSISGSNGQTQALRVTPEGTIQAPGLGSVFVQGLTLDELCSELEARYATTFGPGLLVSPSLTERATTYAFLGGEVKIPGRYTLEGPTTVMQAITLAGGWNVGGNLHQVVVFRRDENWCLKAIKIDVRAPLYGHDPCPANDVWLRDNDLVIVPKSRILCATDVISLYFTRGIYAVFPISYVYDFSQGSNIVPVP